MSHKNGQVIPVKLVGRFQGIKRGIKQKLLRTRYAASGTSGMRDGIVPNLRRGNACTETYRVRTYILIL